MGDNRAPKPLAKAGDTTSAMRGAASEGRKACLSRAILKNPKQI
jgi:hypothetical protein